MECRESNSERPQHTYCSAGEGLVGLWVIAKRGALVDSQAVMGTADGEWHDWLCVRGEVGMVNRNMRCGVSV